MQNDANRQLPKDLRNRLGTAYFLAWVGATFLLAFAAAGLFSSLHPLYQAGIVLHLALPWIALVAVVVYPRDFTLLGNFSSAPVGLALGWFLMGPLHLGSPIYARFVGSHHRFISMGFGLGGIFAAIAIIVALVLDESVRGKKIGFLLHVAQVLFMSLIYGYVAVKEVDVLFDRSPEVVYPSRVVYESHTVKYASVPTLTVEPWGPVKTDNHALSPAPDHPFEAGEPTCMVLREGALGVAWYTTRRCTGEKR
jgi:hypothetical protein